jgi:3-mercaptopyruvate sulfurtransferase SseA
MKNMMKLWWLVLAAGLTLWAPPGSAAETTEGLRGRLASVAWLQANLARGDLRLLDASPPPLHRQQHIPGAVGASLNTFGFMEMAPAELEQRLRAWGVSPGQRIVIYDQGGTYMATRLFWDLIHYGLPADQLFILDGGMAKWVASGGAVSKEPTPAPSPGTVRVTTMNQEVRVRLPEFLAATGEPANNVLLDALDGNYFYGGAAFFNRAGHMPHATLMPADEFYNPDKTFKSPDQIARMLQHLGITPDKQIHTYCGGGGAAAVPFFALKYLLDYPRVKLYQESQFGWLQDERVLPVWTYGAPQLLRDTPWLKAWGNPMLKAFGISRLNILDVRSAEQFKLGHVPLAVNLPAQEFERQRHRPEALAALLGQAGLDRSFETVVISDGGLNPHAALAYLMLVQLGQHQVSVYQDSIERWADLGYELVRPAAVAAPGKPADAALSRPYAPSLRGGVLVADAGGGQGVFPRVFVASGAQPPQRQPEGQVIHLPYAQFLNADGTPKAAKDIWALLSKAGVPRFAELVTFADAPGDAAVNYLVFKLMGFADVMVWAP